MTKRLKIAIIADPEIPIPPLLYGGIERIIDLLIKGLVTLGHEVSLFAHESSVTKAKLFPYLGKSSTKKLDVLRNSLLINKELFTHNYDIIHSFGRLIYLLPQLPLDIPKVMSYQREPTINQIKIAVSLAKKNTLTFTGCSNYISTQISPFATSYPIYNGVNLALYDFKYEIPDEAPLVFLGRIEPIKGAHIAIEVAIKAKKQLIIAGNIAKEHQNYFNEKIEPNLCNQITYIGAINDVQKNKLLGSALAFLMPILWDEPFGIVMAEAMACGTPVIAFKRGSVPEVVIDGYNGFSCDTIAQMVNYVDRIDEIDRKAVRADAEFRFSSETIVKQYLSLYIALIK